MAADLVEQAHRDVENNTTIIQTALENFIASLPADPANPVADTLFQVIALYHQRNRVAHPADLLRLSADEAQNELTRLEDLAMNSEVFSECE